MNMQEDGRLPVLFPIRFELKGYKCFKDEEILKISNSHGKPTRWTFIIGNNGTGKTTLLEQIELLLPKENALNFSDSDSAAIPAPDWSKKEIVPNFFSTRKSIMSAEILQLAFAKGVSIETVSEKSFGWEILKEDSQRYSVEVLSSSGDLRAEKINPNVYFSYWATRKIGTRVEISVDHDTPTHLRELVNAEEWLAQLDYAILREIPGIIRQWKTITDALVEILPDVRGFRPATTKDFKHYIEVETDYGWVSLRQLSYGYQTMLAWVVDLAKRMIEAYPDSDTPLEESAVVLVDEIDLHLHPSWQRRIVGDLSRIFPNVQFIATSHSPLVVQSAERCNIAVLHKDGDRIHIQNIPNQSYQGWSVEEILRDLMEMDSTHSEAFTKALKDFELAIGADDYAAAQAAYQTLDQILHPESVHRKLMRMQMSGLERPAQV
jgi:energy-coupling factor transporter ATP-binding protein EcfA2